MWRLVVVVSAGHLAAPVAEIALLTHNCRHDSGQAITILRAHEAELRGRGVRRAAIFGSVIRCLEIISEASRRLPGELKDRHPQVPWADMAGAGNVYRHDYEDVADDMVWRTVQDSLGHLLTVVGDELQRS